MSGTDAGARRSQPALLWGLVAAVVAAAFLGGYAVGSDSSSVSGDELAELVREAQGPAPQRSADAPVFVSLDGDPMKGSPDAPLTIVEFSDFQCPFCKRFYQETLPLIERDYIDTGRVNLVYRDMPLSNHANAVPAHVAAECAYTQGAFWEYHDVLFDRQSEWNRLDHADLEAQLVTYADELGLDDSFAPCMMSADILQEVRKDALQASGYGATGTPTFFIGNGDTGYVMLTGAKPFEAFQSAIDSRLG